MSQTLWLFLSALFVLAVLLGKGLGAAAKAGDEMEGLHPWEDR